MEQSLLRTITSILTPEELEPTERIIIDYLVDILDRMVKNNKMKVSLKML